MVLPARTAPVLPAGPRSAAQGKPQPGARALGIMRSAMALLILLSAAPAPGRAQASLVILARHAEKAAPTGDSPLTSAGQGRAQALAQTLADVHLAVVIVTQFQRTRLTAAPTALAQGITPLVVRAGPDFAAHAAAVAQAIDTLPTGSAVLVVGHSNTVGPIIAGLGGPSIPHLCDGEFSTLLILDRRPGMAGLVHLLRARFGAAEPPDASLCHEHP